MERKLYRIDALHSGIAGLETQIMVKVNDRWKLHQVHYSKK